MSPNRIQGTLQAALTHHRAGRLDQAASLYEQVRKVAPRHFDAAHLAGTVAYQQHRYSDAVSLLSHALSLDPRSAPCAMRLGLACLGQGNARAAERHLRASLALQPSAAEAWNGLGLVLRALGRPEEAIAAYQRATVLQPTMATAHEQLGALIADTRGFAPAIPHFRKAVELDPGLATAWCNLGLAQIQTGDIASGGVSLDTALSIHPDLPQALLGKGLACQRCHRIEDAIHYYDRTLTVEPRNQEALSARLFCLNYLDTIDAGTLSAAHRTFGRLWEPQTQPQPPATARSNRRSLRVALLSPDLRAHSVSYFLEPLLRHLDPSRFEIVLYHDHAVSDAVSARLQRHAKIWRNFASQPHAWVGERIREDRPDILIDLAGHTGFNRLPLFAQRLAPVQVSYLGYPNTTGLTTMDFRLTDETADPVGSSDVLHTETLLRFSRCAWAYQPPADAPEVAPPPCLDTGAITFGSFNNASKFSTRTLLLWAGILSRVPRSRLFLKGQGIDDAFFQERLFSWMDSRGISRDRLEFAGRTAGLGEHLSLYGKVDVALDTYPYHGTTTTCEALWMGRPVITLSGDRHASRVGTSLLSAVGCPDWIAQSDEDYVAKATHLALDPGLLAARITTLRQQVAISPLLDHASHARDFGEALRRCHAARTSSPCSSTPGGPSARMDVTL